MLSGRVAAGDVLAAELVRAETVHRHGGVDRGLNVEYGPH
jgi:hypothetical protein